MTHANAPFNLHGRRLPVTRVIDDGRPVAHVAKEFGASRQCAHRWVARYRIEGDRGLVDRSSRPHRCPRRTSAQVEQRVLQLRAEQRHGQDWTGPQLAMSARTVSATLRRHQVPYLRECDPLTGEVIRAQQTTAARYERERPGDLVHLDVKKIGRIPDGGGWRAHNEAKKSGARGIGYDYVHAAVDDHSRLAYAEVLPNEQGTTTAGFLTRAANFSANNGVDIREVITDNALNYTRSADFAAALTSIGARHLPIRAHSPWQNGKVERFNRTLQTEWAYRQIFTSNTARADALAPWLDYYNTARHHSALGAQPPFNRLS